MTSEAPPPVNPAAVSEKTLEDLVALVHWPRVAYVVAFGQVLVELLLEVSRNIDDEAELHADRFVIRQGGTSPAVIHEEGMLAEPVRTMCARSAFVLAYQVFSRHCLRALQNVIR